MEHRSHRGRLVLTPFWVSVLCAGALASPQEPQSKTRERPPEPPKQEAPRQEAPKPAETQRPVRPAPVPPAPVPPAPVPPAPASRPQASRPVEERRAVAKDAARFETKYRESIARLNRLEEVYKSKGDQEKVIQLERLRERLAVRREHALEGFRKDLGEEGFKRTQGQIQGGGRKSLEERAKKAQPPGNSEKPGGQ